MALGHWTKSILSVSLVFVVCYNDSAFAVECTDEEAQASQKIQKTEISQECRKLVKLTLKNNGDDDTICPNKICMKAVKNIYEKLPDCEINGLNEKDDLEFIFPLCETGENFDLITLSNGTTSSNSGSSIGASGSGASGSDASGSDASGSSSSLLSASSSFSEMSSSLDMDIDAFSPINITASTNDSKNLEDEKKKTTVAPKTTAPKSDTKSNAAASIASKTSAAIIIISTSLMLYLN